ASRLAMTFTKLSLSLRRRRRVRGLERPRLLLRRDGRRPGLERESEEAARSETGGAGATRSALGLAGPGRLARDRCGRALELVQPADHEAVQDGDDDGEHREDGQR